MFPARHVGLHRPVASTDLSFGKLATARTCELLTYRARVSLTTDAPRGLSAGGRVMLLGPPLRRLTQISSGTTRRTSPTCRLDRLVAPLESPRRGLNPTCGLRLPSHAPSPLADAWTFPLRRLMQILRGRRVGLHRPVVSTVPNFCKLVPRVGL